MGNYFEHKIYCRDSPGRYEVQILETSKTMDRSQINFSRYNLIRYLLVNDITMVLHVSATEQKSFMMNDKPFKLYCPPFFFSFQIITNAIYSLYTHIISFEDRISQRCFYRVFTSKKGVE